MHRILALLLLVFTSSLPAAAQAAPSPASKLWLFAGFKGNSEDGVFYALSRDGYHWTLANGGQPIVHPTEPNELMRDPFLQRDPDGSFHMVWTWAWRSPAVLGYASSPDLLHWTRQRQLRVLANQPAALNAWAPALYYEPAQRRWLLFWSSTIPGRFPGDNTQDGPLNHRIFSTTTRDFSTFTAPKTFFDPGYSVIDATLVQAPPGRFTLIFKDERKIPMEKHLQTATGPTLEGPWSNISAPISEPWSEGAAIISVSGGYLALYDHYEDPQHYGAVFSPDLEHWTDATPQLIFPAGLRHGSFLAITPAEYDRLAALAPEPRQ